MMTFSQPRTTRRRTGRWLTRAVALTAIGVSLVLDFGAMFIVPILFVLVVPFEKMFPRHRSQQVRRPHVI